MRSVQSGFFPLHDGNNCQRTFEAIARLKERNKNMLRNQRAYQLIYDWTKNRCAAAVGAWGGRMVGRTAVGLLGCLKKEQMSENALLQAAEAAKKCYLRPAADTDDWQALQPFGQTEVLVSVIVPVHNGEKDLRQCLNSILAQQCGNTVEIIAVNDNSTDSSSDILEEYANWGEVRRVELTKETGGSAAKARNAGILQAKGEYLLFVDCDDVLLPGAIFGAFCRKRSRPVRISCRAAGSIWMETGNLGQHSGLQNIFMKNVRHMIVWICRGLRGRSCIVEACLKRSGFRQDIPVLRMRSSIF